MAPCKDPSTGAAADANTTTAITAFTPAESKLLLSIFKFSSKPSPDWNKVSADISAASGHSCAERFRVLVKKHGLFDPKGTSGKATTFTDSETRLLLSILKESEKPKPDWNKVSADIAAASGHSCAERFRVLVKKYGMFGATATPKKGRENGSGGSPATTPTPKRTRKVPASSGRKRKNVDLVDDEDEGEEMKMQETPGKKSKSYWTTTEIKDEEGAKGLTARVPQIAYRTPVWNHDA